MQAKGIGALTTGAAVCALTLGLAACGSSSTTTSSHPAAAAGQTSAAATTSAVSSNAATTPGSSVGSAGLSQAARTFAAYTGGKADAAASGTPIKIGLMNDQGGIPSFPEGTIGAQTAVKLINEKLGGVDGHPVTLDTCFVSGSESQGKSCAEQFLAAKVPVIVESNGSVGGASLHSTLAGKIPVIMPNPDSGLEATAKDAFGTNAAVFGTDTGFLVYAKQLKARTASLLYPGDDPVGQTAAKQLEGLLTKAGITVTPSGFNSESPDLLPNVVASGASHTDMTIMLTVSPSSCIAGAMALKQANVTKPVVGLFLCISPQVKQGLGDYPAWTFVDAGTNVELPTDPATKGYLAAMQAYASNASNIGGNSPFTFSAVLGAARALAKAGGTSASAGQVTAALKADTAGEPMLDPAIKYDSVPSLPDLPNLAVRLFQYHGSGKWTDLTGGKWVAPRS